MAALDLCPKFVLLVVSLKTSTSSAFVESASADSITDKKLSRLAYSDDNHTYFNLILHARVSTSVQYSQCSVKVAALYVNC